MQKQLKLLKKEHKFFLGDLLGMTSREVFSLNDHMMVMCYAPFGGVEPSGERLTPQPLGGGCRLAILGQEWAEARRVDGEALETSSHLPDLHWGEPQAYLNTSVKVLHLEAVSLPNATFVVCYEHDSAGPSISCGYGSVDMEVDATLKPFRESIDLGPGSLISLSAAWGGTGFVVCQQAPNEATSPLTCRWTEILAGGIEGNRLRLTSEKPLSIALV